MLVRANVLASAAVLALCVCVCVCVCVYVCVCVNLVWQQNEILPRAAPVEDTQADASFTWDD